MGEDGKMARSVLAHLAGAFWRFELLWYAARQSSPAT